MRILELDTGRKILEIDNETLEILDVWDAEFAKRYTVWLENGFETLAPGENEGRRNKSLILDAIETVPLLPSEIGTFETYLNFQGYKLED